MFGKNIRDGEKVHEWVVDILKDNKVEYLRVPPGPYICSTAVCFFVYEAGEGELYGSVDAGELGTHAFKNKKSLKKVILEILEGSACDDGGLWTSLFELTQKLDCMHTPRPRRASWMESITMRRSGSLSVPLSPILRRSPAERKKNLTRSSSMDMSGPLSSLMLSPTSRSSPVERKKNLTRRLSIDVNGTLSSLMLSPTSRSSPVSIPLPRRIRSFFSSGIENGSHNSI